MSVTGHTDARRPLDFYATPAWCVKAILPFATSRTVLDPCAGDGAILSELPTGTTARGLEISSGRAQAARDRGLDVETRDALSDAPWPTSDLILMNPPFSLASEFVDRALSETRWGVVALLRLNWLAGMKRSAFHRAHPADVYVLPRRPSFTGRGTDACDYAWFVWSRGAPGGRWCIL